MSTTPDVIELVCEAADRDGERLPAPAWWQGTKYPTCEWVSDAGDPVRTFERDFDRNANRAWSCYMLVEDTLTAHGVDRGEPIIRAESHGDGLTITQARALAAALLEAANVAEVQL